jgi:hypothetical protein
LSSSPPEPLCALLARRAPRLRTLELSLAPDDQLEALRVALPGKSSPFWSALECNPKAAKARTTLGESIAKMPALKSLTIHGGLGSPPLLVLTSSSLEYLDMSQVRKGCYLKSLDCPRLHTIVINPFDYGSGLKRLT